MALGTTKHKGELAPLCSQPLSLFTPACSFWGFSPYSAWAGIPPGEGGADGGVLGPKKGCVTLDKSLGFSEPLSPSLKEWRGNLDFADDHEVEMT